MAALGCLGVMNDTIVLADLGSLTFHSCLVDTRHLPATRLALASVCAILAPGSQPRLLLCALCSSCRTSWSWDSTAVRSQQKRHRLHTEHTSTTRTYISIRTRLAAKTTCDILTPGSQPRLLLGAFGISCRTSWSWDSADCHHRCNECLTYIWYACTYVRMSICTCVYICTHSSNYVCECASAYANLSHRQEFRMYAHTYVRICVCVYRVWQAWV